MTFEHCDGSKFPIEGSMTAEEFYKKLLAYPDNLNLDTVCPLTHRGVIHLMNEFDKVKINSKAAQAWEEGQDAFIAAYKAEVKDGALGL